MFRLLFLIAALALALPSLVYAVNKEKIRESTIIYKLKDDATSAQLKRFNALVNKSNIIKKKEIKNLKINVVKLKNIKGFEKGFSELLMKTGAVEFALPDASVKHDTEDPWPNDPDFLLQWHHTTVNSLDAWVKTAGSNTVSVCVLDTGVDTDHPDLVGNLQAGYNVVEDSGNVEAILGHGTATAGVIGAVGNNGIGIAGMTWDISIVPVKINYDDVGSYAYYSDMIEGIRWCADQGVKVANLSYGGAHRADIADAAQYLKDKGGLLFMSAGNDGTFNNKNLFPDYSSFVAVGATDQADVKTYFSEYGPYIDIVAPGISIYTTQIDGYVSWSGTSFSSPMAAGVAALIYSINPDFTPSEVENFIFYTAVDLGVAGEDDYYGHGRVDAGAAVSAAYNYSTPNKPPVANATASPLSGSAPLEVAFDGSGSEDPDGEIVSYVWDFGDGHTESNVTATHIYQADGTFQATLTVTDDRAEQDTSAPIEIKVDPGSNYVNAPTNLTAVAEGSTVTLNWSDNSDNETGFNIERAKKIRGKYAFEFLKTVGENTVSSEDDGVEAGNYKYRVNAFNEDTNTSSDYSNEAAVVVEETTGGDLPAPILDASVNNETLIVTLAWSYECPDCYYEIQRGQTKARGIITDFEVLYDNIEAKQIIDQLPGTGTYYYKVRAYKSDGSDSSDYSNIVTVKAK